ncbi:uncharacterized protein [Haliotis cracherodii]|uniref:uncharacterized protein n=1 Tax=Haliotis cracherodii TaxID=6455 RepID=UPI0039EC6DF0
MTAPTVWQLGEELKGKLLPFLREAKEMKYKIDLEISNKQDEMEYCSVVLRTCKAPVPEDPRKIRRLCESVIENIQATMDSYERLHRIAEHGGVQETGQVTTTCPDELDDEAEKIILPTPETEPPSYFCEKMDTQDVSETDIPDKQRRTSLRPQLVRRGAVEHVEQETIDLEK